MINASGSYGYSKYIRYHLLSGCKQVVPQRDITLRMLPKYLYEHMEWLCVNRLSETERLMNHLGSRRVHRLRQYREKRRSWHLSLADVSTQCFNVSKTHPNLQSIYIYIYVYMNIYIYIFESVNKGVNNGSYARKLLRTYFCKIYGMKKRSRVTGQNAFMANLTQFPHKV